MESIVGKILCDRYRIVRELSQDDFSTVYIAEHLDKTSGQCEIERLQPQYDHEILGSQSWHKVRQTFLTQSNILKNVSQHPQIPQLLAFFECDRQFYLVRERVRGESLAQQLQQSLVNETDAIAWLQEIIGILEFVHKSDLAHFNIQPSSLIQHADGTKLLTNFAGVRNAVLFDRYAEPNILNPDFSPTSRQHKPAPNIDLHALGKTIVYALTGTLAESIQAKSLNIVTSQKSANSNIPKADISPRLSNVLNKMLGDYPDRCYQSAAEVLAELDFERNVVTFPPPFLANSQFPSQGRTTPTQPAPRTKGDRFKVGKILFWSLLLLPFVVALIIIIIGIRKNSYSGFTEYTNSEYNFKIKYPKTWEGRQIDDPITGEIVSFSSPRESVTDPFLEQVQISVEYLSSEPTTLDDYSKTVLERVKEDKNSDFEVYKNYKTKIDKLPARTAIYSREEDGIQLRQMESFTIRGNNVYIVIYTAERAKFSKFYDTVKKIVDSWEIE